MVRSFKSCSQPPLGVVAVNVGTADFAWVLGNFDKRRYLQQMVKNTVWVHSMMNITFLSGDIRSVQRVEYRILNY